MKNLNFDDGYKTFSINDDESKVIRVNVTDFNLVKRLEKAKEDILQELARYDIELNAESVSPEQEDYAILTHMDTYIKEQIDTVFDSKISDVVFGNTSCLSLSGGEMLFVRFLDAIVAEVEEAAAAERAASKKRTSKYTNAAKNIKGKKK